MKLPKWQDYMRNLKQKVSQPFKKKVSQAQPEKHNWYKKVNQK